MSIAKLMQPSCTEAQSAPSEGDDWALSRASGGQSVLGSRSVAGRMVGAIRSGGKCYHAHNPVAWQEKVSEGVRSVASEVTVGQE